MGLKDVIDAIFEIFKKKLLDPAPVAVLLIAVNEVLHIPILFWFVRIVLIIFLVLYLAITLCDKYLRMRDEHQIRKIIIEWLKERIPPPKIIDSNPARPLLESVRFQHTSFYSSTRYRAPRNLKSLITITVILVVLLAEFIGISEFALIASAVPILPPDSYLYTHARGSLTLNDPLNESSGSDWQTAPYCQFVNGAYHVSTSNANNLNTCSRLNRGFANFALEVTMTLNKGDCGGILFRGDSTYSKSYFYRICEDQKYQLIRNSTLSTDPTILTPWKTSDRIQEGTEQENTIAMIARGNKIWLYMNEQQISCISDNSYTDGLLAFAASSNSDNNGTEVAYSNLKVWTLSDGGDGECV